MDKAAYAIKPIKKEDWELAMQLVWDTFLIYEAPEYTQKGRNNFRDFIRDPRLKEMFLIGDFDAQGAYVKDTLVGVLGTRMHHISLLFVAPEYHHQGIASSMLREFFIKRKALGCMHITVNSSPYAHTFYEKLGFHNIEGLVERDGIKFYPMIIDF